MTRTRCSLFGTLLAIVFATSLPATTQDFVVAKTIAVGVSPRYAVLTPDARELYVANTGDDIVTVVDTTTAEVGAKIRVGKAPGSLVVSHDGRRVYALVGDIVFADGREHGPGLVVINTLDKSVIRQIAIAGRADALALTPDNRRLYMTRAYSGVYYVDTEALEDGAGELRQATSDTCPIGIAISKDGQRMFVNYQCGGPGGWTAHDAIAEYALPSHEKIAVETGLANVGDQIALSPDGTELWAKGEDACSRPDYDHTGCPAVPSRIVNVLRVSGSGLTLLKSFGFSLEDSHGRISFSTDGEAFVGGGINIKQIDTRNLGSIRRINIASAGDIAFSPDGNTAWATVSDKGTIDVLVRGKPAVPESQSAASALTLSVVSDTLLRVHCVPGAGCSTKYGGYGVPPQQVAKILTERGLAPKRRGQPVDKLKPGEEPYCFIAERLDPNADFQQILQVHDRKKIEQFRDWTENHGNTAEGSEEFFDITGRLEQNTAALTKYLGRSAVYLSTLVCPNQVATVLIREDAPPVFKVAMDAGGHPVTRQALRAFVGKFLDDLNDPCSDPRPDAKRLYDILIPPAVQAELDVAQSRAPRQRLTLVWELGDQLRYIPMGALFDGKQYLVERYATAVVTNSSELADSQRGDLRALAAGDSNPDKMNHLEALAGVRSELDGLFYTADRAQVPGKIPATILLDDGVPPDVRQFTAKTLQTTLQQLRDPEANQEDHKLIVHIASHFILNDKTESSYLLTRSGPLSLHDLGDKKQYSFHGIWLVTLSACQTAASNLTSTAQPADGREVEGLGFLADNNGAHAVVASLWEIADDSTSKLMQRFYAGLQQTESKAESLREAELSLLNGAVGPPVAAAGEQRSCRTPYPDSYRHPNYWAPFILIGAWQ